MKSQKLYHVSPQLNNATIGRDGLLIAMSQTSARRVYMVEWSYFAWAVAHTSDRHKTPVGLLTAWEFDLRGHAPVYWDFKLFNRAIWYADFDVIVRPSMFTVPVMLDGWAAGLSG